MLTPCGETAVLFLKHATQSEMVKRLSSGLVVEKNVIGVNLPICT